MRVVESFYEEYKEALLELARYSKAPLFVECLSEMKHYWAIKHEFQSIDSINGNQQLSTIQFDVKDAKIYGINYVDENGEKQGCIICHSSIGSVERWMYAVLEEALKKEKSELPLWLSPVQVRVIPVANDKHLEFCKKLHMEGIRYDIDDRDERLGRKIAKASQEWVPYVLVVGDNEIESGKYSVGLRGEEDKREMQIEELVAEVKEKCEGMPYRNIAMSKYLSKRPIFVGAV